MRSSQESIFGEGAIPTDDYNDGGLIVTDVAPVHNLIDGSNENYVLSSRSIHDSNADRLTPVQIMCSEQAGTSVSEHSSQGK